MRKSGLADSPLFSKPKPTEKDTNPLPVELTVTKGEPGSEKAVYNSSEESDERPVDQPVDQPTGQSTNRLTNRPIDQSTNQSAKQSTTGSTSVKAKLGPVMEKPKSFYITYKVDRWLDEAVRYLKEKGLYKADRSVLVNALLHDHDHYTPASLDKLQASLLTHLTNKSLKRVESTE